MGNAFADMVAEVRGGYRQLFMEVTRIADGWPPSQLARTEMRLRDVDDCRGMFQRIEASVVELEAGQYLRFLLFARDAPPVEARLWRAEGCALLRFDGGHETIVDPRRPDFAAAIAQHLMGWTPAGGFVGPFEFRGPTHV